MKLIEKFKAFALTVSVAYLFSLILGRFISNNYLNFYIDYSLKVTIGFICLLSIIQAFNMLTALTVNIQRSMETTLKFKKFESEIKNIGIKTPLDFSFAMCNITFYNYLPKGFLFPAIFGLKHNTPFVLIGKSIKMFENQFGRKPECFELGDWNIISRAETSKFLNKEIDDVRPSDFLCNVSTAVLDYFNVSVSEN